MSDLIKTLKAKAVEEFYNELRYIDEARWFADRPLTSNDYERIDEKFAELIVQECAKIVNDFGEDVENGDIFRSKNNTELLKNTQSGHLGPLLWEATRLIEQHFSVKSNET
jgi:hypothetical protein